jgi:hypothetical protein
MDLSPKVFIQVVPIDSDPEIGWGATVAERLADRVADVSTGASARAATFNDRPSAAGCELDEVTASLGVTLAAEVGAFLTGAAGATFEVPLAYRRRGRADSSCWAGFGPGAGTSARDSR